MVNIANENSISNVCTRMTFIGSKSEGRFAKIDDLGIENLSVLHLDLEGGEGDAIIGALGVILCKGPLLLLKGTLENIMMVTMMKGYDLSLIHWDIIGQQ